MITIRTGNYTPTEKENLSELFSCLADWVCVYCDSIVRDECCLDDTQCIFKHIIRDMRDVDCPKKNDKTVT